MMTYKIKAHPTEYGGVQFRSRLEARWACFFDLAGWEWEYEPIDLEDWTPDFRVEIEDFVLLVEVKPYYNVEEFYGHPCMDHFYGIGIPADSSAAFGINPLVTKWEMSTNGGGGEFQLRDIIGVWPYMRQWWKQAGNTVQWKPRG